MNPLTLNSTIRAILKTAGAVLLAIGWTDAAGAQGLEEHGNALVDAIMIGVGAVIWLWGFVAGIIRERITKRREGIVDRV
jgi:hypothetical protein